MDDLRCKSYERRIYDNIGKFGIKLLVCIYVRVVVCLRMTLFNVLREV